MGNNLEFYFFQKIRDITDDDASETKDSEGNENGAFYVIYSSGHLADCIELIDLILSSTFEIFI